MGIRAWGVGVVAAAVVVAVTASGAPVVAAAEKTSQLSWWDVAPMSDLPAGLADKTVADTPPTDRPDTLENKWVCSQPIRIYYTATTSPDLVRVQRELEYPVQYLRDLGYDVTIVREVAYQSDYRAPVTRGDVLLVAAAADAQTVRLSKGGWLAVTDPMVVGTAITSAKVTVDAHKGLTSTVLLHEFGHVLGLEHKDGSVMGVNDASALGFDAAETAAIDCR